jgi:hypothetical protein
MDGRGLNLLVAIADNMDNWDRGPVQAAEPGG